MKHTNTKIAFVLGRVRKTIASLKEKWDRDGALYNRMLAAKEEQFARNWHLGRSAFMLAVICLSFAGCTTPTEKDCKVEPMRCPPYDHIGRLERY
jgi:hypothetical protein